MTASPSSSHLRTHRSSRPPPPIGVVVAARDPLASVMRLGSRKHLRVMLLAMLGALAVHGSAAARVAVIDVELLRWSQAMRSVINDKLAATYDVEIEKPKPPEPPPPEETKVEEKAPPPPPRAAAPQPKDAPPPPPAAAQAGKVLTQEPDPNTPVDFTNSFVVGSGDSYAGGVTQTNGTSSAAVYNRAAQAGGVPGGTGTKVAPVMGAVDRSRTVSSARADWSCTFPSEADTEQIDEMTVPIEATVGPDGHVSSAHVVKDPGYGFGRAAVQCALRQGPDTFNVALDHDGTPIAGTRRFNVRFTR